MPNITPGISGDTTTSNLGSNYMQILALLNGQAPQDTGDGGYLAVPPAAQSAAASPAPVGGPPAAPNPTPPWSTPDSSPVALTPAETTAGGAWTAPNVASSGTTAPTPAGTQAGAAPAVGTPATSAPVDPSTLSPQARAIIDLLGHKGAQTVTGDPSATNPYADKPDHPANKYLRWIGLLAALKGGGATGAAFTNTLQTDQAAADKAAADKQAAKNQYDQQQQDRQQQQQDHQRGIDQQQIENRQGFIGSLAKLDPTTQESQIKSLTPAQEAMYGISKGAFYDPSGKFIPVTPAEKVQDPAAMARVQSYNRTKLTGLDTQSQSTLHDSMDKDSWEKTYGVPYENFQPLSTAKTDNDATKTGITASAGQQTAQGKLFGYAGPLQQSIHDGMDPTAFEKTYGIPYDSFKPGSTQRDAQGSQRVQIDQQNANTKQQGEKDEHADRGVQQQALREWRAETQKYRLDTAADHRSEFNIQYGAGGKGNAHSMKLYDDLTTKRLELNKSMEAMQKPGIDDGGNPTPPPKDTYAKDNYLQAQQADQQLAKQQNNILNGLNPDGTPLQTLRPMPVGVAGSPSSGTGAPTSRAGAGALGASPTSMVSSGKPYKPQLQGPWNNQGKFTMMTRRQVLAMPQVSKQAYAAELEAYQTHTQSAGKREEVLKMVHSKAAPAQSFDQSQGAFSNHATTH